MLLLRRKQSSYSYASTSIYILPQMVLLHMKLFFDGFVTIVIYIKNFGKSALLISVKAQILVYEKKSLGLSK